MQAEPAEDHRTRTAAHRRLRMRRRLVESALEVIARDGLEATTIDTVIRTAGVSRGSFYNYFDSTEDLVQAASNDLKGEMLLQVIKATQGHPDPATRLAAGFKTFAVTVATYPELAQFVQGLDLSAANTASAVSERFPIFLRNGIAAGQFVEQPPAVMIDLVTGCVIKCVARTISGTADATYVRHLVAGVLRGLGLPPDQAWQISAVEAGPIDIPADGLLGRLHQMRHNHATLAQGV
ncbi:MAG: TetR/AcrR family transcriptional regulator [Candidatus Devosia phytovorans]|uniref:TetR/AcrR family transcriptional regulator n=1 Tax=Candidatus Devosia phytovorans TaxID=3121372 RepID=A0AAJ5VWZ6_9HYPH|nr:TetR/AcrR family transcriptional regulator [Devosia sp.]WEK04939.1 MAG: TetR/AcrR family transcriptional regulator [Devosia sp.]